MYNASIEPEASLDWIESTGAKAWARSDLPQEPLPDLLERRKLQQSIADDEAEIMRLEDSIQHLRQRTCRNRARLAPVRRLPNETLSAIFLDWLDLRNQPTTERGRFVPPSTIMKVCQRWTRCAISTPAIWTHGTYRIKTSDFACLDSAKVFKTFFDRTGSLNLEVYFDGSDENYNADKVWRKVMVPSLFRMGDLTITGRVRRWEEDPSPLYDWPDRKIFESLTLCTRLSQLEFYENNFPESESQARIVLPTVRSLQFNGCDGHPPFHCPVLKACEIRECSLSQPYALLLSVSSPLLERVQFYTNFPVPGRIVTPPFLRITHLEIDLHDDLAIAGWFSNVPNLSSLDLCLYKHDIGPQIAVIPLSSYPALTSLTLDLTDSTRTLGGEDIHFVQEWMIQAHALVELRLNFEWGDIPFEGVCRMERYIEPLLTTKRDPPCFPHLKHITFEGEQRLKTVLLQLLVERATDVERVEAGFPPYGITPGIVQRPCLLTLVDSSTLPNMNSVGLKEFLEICRSSAVRKADETE